MKRKSLVETLLSTLNTLVPDDKLKHFFYGTLVFYFTYFVLLLILPNNNEAVIYSIIIANIIAIGKEVYDYFHRSIHTPDIMDYVFTSIPSWLFGISLYLYLK